MSVWEPIVRGEGAANRAGKRTSVWFACPGGRSGSTPRLPKRVKRGRWANEHKRAAAAILDRQTFYLDVEDTHQGIKHSGIVPSLSAQNTASIEIGKESARRPVIHCAAA